MEAELSVEGLHPSENPDMLTAEATAFIPKRGNGPTADLLDGDTSSNGRYAKSQKN